MQRNEKALQSYMLVGIQNGIATLENSGKFFKKEKEN